MLRFGKSKSSSKAWNLLGGMCSSLNSFGVLTILLTNFLLSNNITLKLFNSNGTSMISLIIPPKDQIARISKMLADEFGTASNIKSRVNRLSVLGAITSVQHRLKLYAKGIGSLSGQYILSIIRRLTVFTFTVPPNGLVIYCGTIVTEEGKEKKVNIDFEPFKPINTSLYLCDNKVKSNILFFIF